MQNPHSTTAVQWIRSYTLPQLTTGLVWYISFYAFDPNEGQLRRKRIRISPKIKKVSERKQYANEMIERITIQLRMGWNPWIKFKNAQSYATWQEACDAYRNYLAKLKADDLMREKTMYGYINMLKRFEEWNDSQKQPIFYAYQFDYRLLVRFVDWLWVDQGRSVTTRDNYVTWLKQFGHFTKQKMFTEDNPAAELELLGAKVKSGKNRTIIPADKMMKLKEWCRENNPHYLLACYILYYCFVRPKEMTYIQLKHISIKKGTLFIPDFSSKNKKAGTVTLPDCVIKLMLELEVFKADDECYLFSDGMKPGKEYRTPKQFSDFWTHKIRQSLKFPLEWKFYSLKDTGITDLIRSNTDLLSVRNQARHHSLLMTDLYTPHDIEEANEVIRHRFIVIPQVILSRSHGGG